QVYAMDVMKFYGAEIAKGGTLPNYEAGEDLRLLGGDFLFDNTTQRVIKSFRTVDSSLDRPSMEILLLAATHVSEDEIPSSSSKS
ncbi:unnamed protein product, partial [Cyprideis torosa]